MKLHFIDYSYNCYMYKYIEIYLILLVKTYYINLKETYYRLILYIRFIIYINLKGN